MADLVEIDAARDFHAEDPHTDAALRTAGFDEAATVETVVTVALNILTNCVNNVAQTNIDFPKVLTKLGA